LDVQSENELLSALRLLVSEDQCHGRFVFNRQVPAPSKKTTKEPLPGNLLSGGGGDNSKNQLQSLLARAGHEAPTYKTRQLRNNLFRSTVIFNGLNFDGQPCNSKKIAEKDAAAEALLWLKGESHSTATDIDHMSMLLKKSKKKDRKRSSTRSAKWG
jgi:ATP-dependent RNA helicase DHX36